MREADVKVRELDIDEWAKCLEQDNSDYQATQAMFADLDKQETTLNTREHQLEMDEHVLQVCTDSIKYCESLVSGQEAKVQKLE
jgi:hypothetical protein